MAQKNFEQALERLEQITRQLEESDLPLEESLKIFDEGVKLADYCNQKLGEAQKKVDILLRKSGAVSAVPFEQGEGPASGDEC